MTSTEGKSTAGGHDGPLILLILIDASGGTKLTERAD